MAIAALLIILVLSAALDLGWKHLHAGRAETIKVEH